MRGARNIAGAVRGGTNGGDKPMIRASRINGPDVQDSNAITDHSDQQYQAAIHQNWSDLVVASSRIRCQLDVESQFKHT